MWEYKVSIIKPTNQVELQDRLNQYGKDGWELVQMSSEGVAVFKKFVYVKEPKIKTRFGNRFIDIGPIDDNERF